MPSSITSPRSLLLITTLAGLLYLAYTYRAVLPTSLSNSFASFTPEEPSQDTMSSFSSPYAKWYTERTRPHPSPSTFHPTRPALRFLVTHAAQAIPRGFTLAFFAPNIAVDARGRVLELTNAEDFDAIVRLARRTLNEEELPQAETYLNTWMVKQSRTEQPIARIYVPVVEGGEFGEVKLTSVQGYDGKARELAEPVKALTQLPDVLWELFGLVLEARNGYVRDEEDKEMIRKVKAALDLA